MAPALRFDTLAEVAEHAASQRERRSHRFGTWEFCPESGEVLSAGATIQLTKREAEVLELLIQRYPIPLNELALERIVYPERVAVDAPFTNWRPYVNRLRRKVGRDVVANVPKRGWRFNPEAVMD